MKHTKYFLIGSKGMLGSDVLPVLQETGFGSIGDRPFFDITDIEKVRSAITWFAPDVVVNCSAYTNVDGAEDTDNINEAYDVNNEAIGHLAIVCKNAGVKLVHISTDFVFDGNADTPYNEDDITNPLNVYGRSKLAGENQIKKFADDYLIIRTSWLYGKGGNNFVKMIRHLAGEKEQLRVIFDQVGTPTYTVDLARAMQNLIDMDAKGLYHFSNQGSCSWYDFALRIIDNMDESVVVCKELKPIYSSQYKCAATRPAYSVMDKSKYERDTGRLIPHWEDALKRYMDGDKE